MGKLDGKSAIIVGASSGIGKATAELFAAEGASVAITARRAGALQEVAASIAARTTGHSPLTTHPQVVALPADATDREQMRAVVEFTKTAFGRIDILVYATGINIPERKISQLTPAAWDNMLATNLTGAFHCTQLVLPIMREQGGGLVIYISSIAGLKAEDISGPAYQAGKRGMIGLAHGTMAEEKQHGIRTSVIYPGLVETPILAQRPVMPPPEQLAHALQPEDVAECCLLIAALPPRAHVPDLTLMPARL